MAATTEHATARLVERLMVEKYDHDCEAGHGPGCVPVEVIRRYEIAGEPVTDPDMIARIEAQIGGA
jgi:hypothetical protein